MATYQITTTTAEETVLGYAVNKLNAGLGAGETPWTKATLVDEFVRRQLRAFRQAALDADNEEVCGAYEGATMAQRQQIRAVLGLA